MNTKFPEKAFLLAAGLGERLWPLTSAFPKPLLPLWNRPLIDHILDLLQENGVKEVVVNTHWQKEKLKQHLEALESDLIIHLSPEENIKGTGGALAAWRDFFSDAPFWVVNGDIAAEVDLSRFRDAFCSLPDLIGSCWVTRSRGPRTVEMDYAGRITCYRSPDAGLEGTFTFCGVQLLSPEIFLYLPQSPFFSLVDVYENAMQNNHFIKGVDIDDSYWNDAGTLERYRDIHRETRHLALSGKPGGGFYNPKFDLQTGGGENFFCVGAGVTVSADVTGEDSIVSGNTVLDEHTALKNSVVLGGKLAGIVRNACCIGGEYVTEKGVLQCAEALKWKLSDSAFEFIGRRGSNRSFWRGYNSEERIVIVIDHGGRADNTRYGPHTELLKELNVPVPELFYMSDDFKVLALEDMGGVCLADKIKRTSEKTEELYRDVLKTVANFHLHVTREMDSRRNITIEPAFDADLYAWEHSLFEKYLLRSRFGYECLPDDVREELSGIAEELLRG
ncbi:MAG: sugar phosphate nucleotidyltransferase, partial [Kiritimatiellia bacterium]